MTSVSSIGGSTSSDSLPPQSSVFDKEGALERLDDDSELLLQVIEIFLETLPEVFSNIKAAIAEERFDDDLMREFHSLKSSAGSCGAAIVQAIAARGEKNCRSGDFDTISDIFSELQVAAESFCQLFPVS